jgi:hypothetical protein
MNETTPNQPPSDGSLAQTSNTEDKNAVMREIPADSAAPGGTEILDLRPGLVALEAARLRAEKVTQEIESYVDAAALAANEINQLKTAVTESRGEIDRASGIVATLVAQAQPQVAQIQQQVEWVKTAMENGRASLELTNKQTAENNAQAAAALENVRNQLKLATEAANRAEAIKTQIEQNAEVASTRSAHIEDGRVYVDKKRSEIDVVFNQAQQSANSAEAQHQASRSSAENLTALLSTAQTAKANIDSNGEAIAQLKRDCEQHVATAKKLADRTEEVDSKLKKYEEELKGLLQQSTERLKMIDALLPGATSAGLASAFGQRRAFFKWPQRIWQGIFVSSVLALLVIAWEFKPLISDPGLTSFRSLGMSLLRRLPFALPVIWLAIYASRHAALAKRLEEDYGFKETVSRSFEGYRRQMADIGSSATPETPLGRLCVDTLTNVMRPPGRIYEAHRNDVSPMTALADSAVPIADAASKLIPKSSVMIKP